MAASAGAVRAGGAYIEIFAKDGAFQQAMTRVQNRMKAIGSSMSSFGSTMGLGGAAMAAPMVLAARTAAQFEDTMLGLRAATTLTGAQLDAAREKVLQLSAELQTTPTKVGMAFQSLAKAGVTFDSLMSGALETAVQFGKMAPELGMDVVSEQMNKAANSFGVSFREVADTISATADTTETSVAGLFAAFGDVAPYAAQLGLTLSDTTVALAALSKGMNVEEAGTAYKVFLQRLIAPAEEAKGAFESLGLSMRSFRDAATGNILPPDQIAAVFANATAGRDQMQVQEASAKIFGDRGIKAISTFSSVGVDGFRRLKEEMGQSKSVAEKYEIVMSGLSGMFESLQGAVERLANAWITSLGPATASTRELFSLILDAVSGIVQQFPVLSKLSLNVALSLLGISTAVVLVGKSITLMGTALGTIPMLIRGVIGAMSLLAANPVMLTVGLIAGAIGAAIVAARNLSPEFKKASDGWLEMTGLMGKPLPKQDAGMEQETEKAIVNIRRMLDKSEIEANQQMAALQNAQDKSAQQAAKDREDAIRRGQSITESVRTPEERFADQAAELADLRDQGAITLETYGRALKQAANEAAQSMEAAMPGNQASAANAIGQTVGTFSSSFDGLMIGPELNKLEQPAIQTAANTAAMAETLVQMARDGVIVASSERQSPPIVAGASSAVGGVQAVASLPARQQAAMAGVAQVADTQAIFSSVDSRLESLIKISTEHLAVAKESRTVFGTIARALTTGIDPVFS
jgi:TP901 family phage tail tape measure protein